MTTPTALAGNSPQEPGFDHQQPRLEQGPNQEPVMTDSQQPKSFDFKWLVIALMALAILFLLFSKKETPPPPATPVAAAPVVDASQNGGKLILAEICVLQSDGTARLISAQNDLLRAQQALQKHPGNKEVKALIAKLEEAAKPVPPHGVIAEVPKSVLPDGADCDSWRRARAYELVVGAPKYPPKS